MKQINLLILGVRSYYDAVLFIAKHRLWYYFAIPAALSVGLYYLGEYYDDLSKDIPVIANDLRELMFVLANKLFFKMLFYLFHESTKYMVIAILSPMVAILSEKVEEIITGNTYPFVWKYYVNDVKRGLRISVTSMAQEYAYFLVWLIIAFFITPLQELNTFVVIFIGFYFYGFGFMDYVNERRRLDIEQSVHFTKKHFGLAIGLGIIYSGLFEIPYAGVIIAPVVGIVAGTLAMSKTVDLGQNIYARKKRMLEDGKLEEGEKLSGV